MQNAAQKLILAALLALPALAIAQPAATSASRGPQMAKHFEFSRPGKVKVDYLLYLPQGYEANGGKRWPLMLFLHGAGERGSDVWKVAIHGPGKYAAAHPDFPFIIVSPQCPEREIWSKEVLLKLMDEVIATYAVDTHRIYLTGLSMGGYGTWDLGLCYPEKFAAIVPICGGGQMISLLLSRHDKAQELKSLGVWAFHGGKDPVVPLEESQRMVDRLKTEGLKDVKLTVYPDAGHNSWTETYDNPELYNWLLKHSR
jgi:predicted peptidase